MNQPLIKRTVLLQLENHLENPEISLIIGARQAGKTTLMLYLQDLLRGKGQKTLWFNLDVETDRRSFESQTALIDKIKLDVGLNPATVFIDEIQKKENPGAFLKGIYDLNLPYKFVVSGSASLELKEKIHESLVGRKRVFELSTLTFKEFVNFKTDYRYEDKLTDFFRIEKEKAASLFSQYLLFGGYPRIVLAETVSEKKKEIEEIYQSYLLKDISYLLKVVKTEVFENLVRVIASQTGQLINYSELSSTLGLSIESVKNYLWYLEKTFILSKVTPFFRNIRSEISKSPVFYFNDLGLRNFILGNLERQPEDLGFVFQNFVHNELKAKAEGKINFWRTKDGAEVDFVWQKGGDFVPIEVKSKTFKKVKITRSLRSFSEKYQPKEAIIVNPEFQAEIKAGKTKFKFLPYYFSAFPCQT